MAPTSVLVFGASLVPSLALVAGVELLIDEISGKPHQAYK
jgi:hypothetical protein